MAYLFALVAILLSLSNHAYGQAGLVLSEPWNGFGQTGGVGGGTVTTTAETYNKNGGCYRQAVNGYDSFSQTLDLCNAANNVLQVTNIMGDDTSNCNNNWEDPAGQVCTDPLGCFPNKHRAEVISNDANIRPDIGQEYWIGFRIWVPANFPANITESLIVYQAVPGTAPGPDTALRMHTNGQWRHEQNRTLDGQADNDLITEVGAIQRGSWNNFVIHFIRQINNTGLSEFWYNGNKRVTFTGISSKINSPGTLSKWGIYHGAKVGLSSDNKNYTIFFDDVKVAFGANHLATVSPTTPAGACPVDPPPVADFPEQPILDNFNRANENPIGAPWVNGITGNLESCELITNFLEDGAGKGECYHSTVMTTPQEVYGTWLNATNHPDNSVARLYGCLTDTLSSTAADGYALRFTKSTAAVDTIAVEQLTNNVYTQIDASWAQELTNGDKVGMKIHDSGLIEVFLNNDGAGWAKLGEVNDETPYNCTSSRTGVRSASALHDLDDFGAGPPAPAGTNTQLLRAQQFILGD